MRKIEYNGKIAYLTEVEIHSLARRFDPRWATTKGNRYRKKISCILCKRFANGEGCGHCPLSVWATDDQSGCIILIQEILGPKWRWKFILTGSYIEWNIMDKEARAQLMEIREAILNLPKLEIGGGK